MPRATESMPSVVTKGERRMRATNRPLTRPINAASASPKSAASAIVAPGTCAAGVPAKKRIDIIVTTALSAQTEPTDRSMPPLMMTKVSPSDIKAMKLKFFEMLRRLRGVMKTRRKDPDNDNQGHESDDD